MAISRFSAEEKKIAKFVIEALILQHQAKVLATLPAN